MWFCRSAGLMLSDQVLASSGVLSVPTRPLLVAEKAANTTSPASKSALRQRCLLAVMAVALTSPTLAATFVVDSAADAVDANPGNGVCATAAAVCTLRAAIEEANASAGGDHIDFNIGGGGAVTITRSNALPDLVISSSIQIHGYTQPGASPNTLAIGNDATILVRYDGGSATGNGLYFTSGSSGSSLRGLSLSGHSANAIIVDNASGITIAGNFIGTDASGADLHNGNGIFMLDDADNHQIGGPNPADRNVIAANLSSGILIGVSTSSNNTLRNNYIGVAPDGLTPRRNGQFGVVINSAQQTSIRDNVIASNGAAVQVVNIDAQDTLIQGNSIGVGVDGVTAIGTGEGIIVHDGGSGSPNGVWVGGIDPGQGNVIANAQGSGVRVDRTLAANPDAPAAVAIRGNAIYNNAGMGVDLADSATGNGVGVPNPNDTDDADTGANNFQNFPVVTSATSDGAVTTVGFTYDAYPVGSFWVDVYASPNCDASGYGEGRSYLGSVTVTSDENGHVTASIDALPVTTVGHFITLTATDMLLWSTSEFSACLPIAAGAGATPPVMGDVPNQTPTVGVPFNLDISAYVTPTEGDPIALYDHVGTLPPGLTLNSGTGLLSGTPTTAGVWTVSFAARDDDGSSNFDFATFNVSEPPLPAGGTMQFSLAAQTVSEAIGALTVTVTRTGGSSGPVSVAYASSDATATAPADYAVVSGILNWADGDTSPKSFTVTIADDAVPEAAEQFTLSLTDNAPTDSGSVGSPSVQTVTITDNDGATAIQLPAQGPFSLALMAALIALVGVFTRGRWRA